MTTLHHKLAPTRFPNMSLQLAAILGFILERQYTTPALAELVVTPDGHLLARPEGEPGPLAHIAAEADLRANLRRLGMAALENAHQALNLAVAAAYGWDDYGRKWQTRRIWGGCWRSTWSGQ